MEPKAKKWRIGDLPTTAQSVEMEIESVSSPSGSKICSSSESDESASVQVTEPCLSTDLEEELTPTELKT